MKIKKAFIFFLITIMLMPTYLVSAASAYSLSEENYLLMPKETINLSFLKFHEPIQSGVKWKSSNTKIATVNKKGTVKAISAGKVEVTATYGKKKLICFIKVSKPENVIIANQGSTTEPPTSPEIPSTPSQISDDK